MTDAFQRRFRASVAFQLWTCTLLLLAMGLVNASVVAAGETVHEAIAANHVPEAQALITADPTLLNQRNALQQTPLLLAAARGNATLVKWLLDKGADMELADQVGITPVQIAAQINSLSCVKLLVEKGANLHVKDRNGRNALGAGYSHPWKDIVDYIKNAEATNTPKGAAPPFTPEFSAAITAGDVTKVKAILQADKEQIYARDAQLRTPLILVATNPNTTLALELIAAEAYVDAADAKGFTALIMFSSNNDAKAVQALLAAGANIHLADLEGQTALHRAAKNNSMAVVKLLIAAGANLQLKENYESLTPEGLAVKYKRTEIAEYLKGVAAGTIPTGSANSLVQAILRGDPAQVQDLLKTSPALATQTDSSGRTPLHAAMTGKSEIAMLLLTDQTDVNKADPNNWRPLHIAAEAGRADMVKLLLDHAADPNGAAQQGAQTPLYLAAEYGFTEVVKNLLAAQANPNLNTSLGISPLHRAAECGFIDIVSLLILAKADVNVKDQTGKTALDYAIVGNHRDVIALLQKNGATSTLAVPAGDSAPAPAAGGRKADPKAVLDPNQAREFLDACAAYDGAKMDALLLANPDLAYAKDTSHYCALHLLTYNPKKGTPELAKKIIDLGVPVDSPSTFQRTPLMRAAEMGNLQLVRYYIQLGANVNAPDGNGWTPLWVAAHMGTHEDYAEIIRLLLDHKADATVKDTVGRLTPYAAAKKAGRTLMVQALEARAIKE